MCGPITYLLHICLLSLTRWNYLHLGFSSRGCPAGCEADCGLCSLQHSGGMLPTLQSLDGNRSALSSAVISLALALCISRFAVCHPLSGWCVLGTAECVAKMSLVALELSAPFLLQPPPLVSPAVPVMWCLLWFSSCIPILLPSSCILSGSF